VSRLRSKRVRIGKYTLPALLLVSLAVGTVAAAAYVVLTWYMSLTVLASPRVHFWDGSSAANTMTITMNIFPDVRTIDEDAAWNIRSNGTGNIYIRVSAMDTADVAEVRIKAYVGATTLFDQAWSTSTTDWSGPYATTGSVASPAIYDLWIEVLGAGTAFGTTSITVDLKVESP